MNTNTTTNTNSIVEKLVGDILKTVVFPRVVEWVQKNNKPPTVEELIADFGLQVTNYNGPASLAQPPYLGAVQATASASKPKKQADPNKPICQNVGRGGQQCGNNVKTGGYAYCSAHVTQRERKGLPVKSTTTTVQPGMPSTVVSHPPQPAHVAAPTKSMSMLVPDLGNPSRFIDAGRKLYVRKTADNKLEYYAEQGPNGEELPLSAKWAAQLKSEKLDVAESGVVGQPAANAGLSVGAIPGFGSAPTQPSNGGLIGGLGMNAIPGLTGLGAPGAIPGVTSAPQPTSQPTPQQTIPGFSSVPQQPNSIIPGVNITM
ncbi:Hypothetical protein ORPV_990 [Orpheovirus IHUMI-LCC2]|uniref:Uncharacterized protein n=1 Tax=Orpheovirus IHUMI-LCC2 TaxID=2023057 RepID=A0A2I2L5T1_9VIRU|nr:Hypothetical protein ORPV_990 [Orpheovirus IHUMI-LCC2]SNW62894.1 Hypothetical protein ORPV_990 [Orpheovirus IHUMI-LCC2]